MSTPENVECPEPPEAPTWYEATEGWAWENGWTAGYTAATAPENVECPTCGGRKRIYEDAADAFGRPCPDCTPENVETPNDQPTKGNQCEQNS